MWILPTLSRPKQCAAVLDRISETYSGTYGILFINGYETLSDYFQDNKFEVPKNWEVLLSKANIGALGALNKVFELYPNEPFYGFIGDDEFVQTQEWDEALIDAAGDWGIAIGSEGRNVGGRAQPFPCIGGKLARAVEYLAIPECWHWFGLDSMWGEIGLKLGNLIKLDTIKIEHKHPYLKTAANDGCYKLGSSRKDIDQQHYYHWLRTQLATVVKRVQEAKAANRNV